MIRVIFIFFFVMAAAGCGTVIRGTKQGVKFQSEPPGAAVTVVRAKKVKTRWDCVSPCELQLSRKRDFDVTFAMDGYKPATARLASRIGAKGGATAIPGNFVLGGGIGFIVDAGTGANMQLKPDPMRARLATIDSTENSEVYDVRIEGGGVEDVQTSAANSAVTGRSAANINPAPKLKRLTRDFGADGSSISDASVVATFMSDPHGVLITNIDAEGAAARAGLNVGDVVQSINSSRVSDMDDITSVVAQIAPGETVPLTIWRNRELYEATLAF